MALTELGLLCAGCGDELTLYVRYTDYLDWQNGKKCCQNAFPYLPPASREILISHLCPECQKQIFGDDEE